MLVSVTEAAAANGIAARHLPPARPPGRPAKP